MFGAGSCSEVSSVPVSVSSGHERSTSLCRFSPASATRRTGEPLALLSIRLFVKMTAVTRRNRARQLYKNISMLFLFPVKDGKLSTGVNATFDASRYG